MKYAYIHYLILHTPFQPRASNALNIKLATFFLLAVRNKLEQLHQFASKKKTKTQPWEHKNLKPVILASP